MLKQHATIYYLYLNRFAQTVMSKTDLRYSSAVQVYTCIDSLW